MASRVIWTRRLYGDDRPRCEACGTLLDPDEGKVCRGCEQAIARVLAVRASERDDRLAVTR